ncbi:MAG: FAD:protein FMN transferase [Micropruina sp.]|nr:FAD:protein FMN transferase [Micropruina sp.]
MASLGGAFTRARGSSGPLAACRGRGVEPAAAELHALAGRLATLPFDVVAGTIVRTGDCTGVDLNAIAGGYLVDRAVAAAVAAGAVDVLASTRAATCAITGARVLRVGIEDPAAVGGPPKSTVDLHEGAIATSGQCIAGFRWKPGFRRPGSSDRVPRRPGRPSTTVRAPDALTADACATVAGVCGLGETRALVASCPGHQGAGDHRGRRPADLREW